MWGDSVKLTSDGIVRLWTNRRIEAESSASGEYLLQSDSALETLLNAPASDKKLQDFLMFCKAIFSEENVSFALEVQTLDCDEIACFLLVSS